jgi:hypothetical protein
VDSLSAVVGKETRPLLDMKGVGEVISPENARAADGKVAVIVHRGQADTVDGLVARFNSSPKPPSRRAPVAKYGTYTNPGEASDKRADAIAWWDFTVFQEGANLHECVRKVKQRNPKHRVVLRLVIPGGTMLLYTYDARSREALRIQAIDLQLGPIADLVDTVTLNEEEPGNMLRGYYGSILPPESLYLWRHEFERETGKPFVWPSKDVNDWLGEKFTFMLNDLYTYCKQRYPKVKVYQWVELRGYGNISGFYEYVRGEDLKMDGYVVEWNDSTWESLIDTPFGKASARFGYFENYIRNLQERKGLRPGQLLGQVWAYDPTLPMRSTLDQIEAERQCGISYIYFFWPMAGLPQIPETMVGSDAEKAFANQVWGRFKPMVEAERAGRG